MCLVKPVPPVEGLEAVDDAFFGFMRTPAPGAATRASWSLTVMALVQLKVAIGKHAVD